MKKLIGVLLASAALATGCTIHDAEPVTDGGGGTSGSGLRYDQLDQVHAALDVRQSADDTAADVTLTLTASDSHAVVLQDGQEVDVNSLPLSALGSGGTYTLHTTAGASYAVRVDEPRHGVLTTSYTPPDPFQVTSQTFNLAGTTLTWSSPDSTASVKITLAQNNASGLKSHDYALATDTGTKTFSETDLRDFVQGYPVTVTITKSRVASTPLGGVASSAVTLERTRSTDIDPTST